MHPCWRPRYKLIAASTAKAQCSSNMMSAPSTPRSLMIGSSSAKVTMMTANTPSQAAAIDHPNAAIHVMLDCSPSSVYEQAMAPQVIPNGAAKQLALDVYNRA